MTETQTAKPKSKRLPAHEFEVVTRQLRWLCILTVAVFFPYAPVYQPYATVLIATGVLYNLIRYYKPLLRQAWFSSPLTILAIDTLFLGILIWFLGTVNTPFTGYLIFLMITAVYCYRLIGGLLIGLIQAGLLLMVSSMHVLPEASLSTLATVLVTTSILLGIGLQVDRFTAVEEEERESLERSSSEADIERSHLTALINTLPDAIFVVNNDGRVILYNDAAATLVGITDSMQGMALADCLPLYARKDAEAKPVDLFAGETTSQRRRDLSMTGFDGQTADLDIAVHAVGLENLDTTDYIVVCEDITRERSIDEQRSEFISVASHELRTPIAIMEAALSTAMSQKDLSPETRSLLEQSHSNAALLAGIITDLSTLATARNDNIPTRLQRLDAYNMLDQLAAGFKPQTDEKQQTVSVNVDEHTPVVLTTERHVQEILQNYLTNAVKYTPAEGEIRLAAKPAKNGGVVFSVSDDGIGITPADQKHLFTKFFRVEDYRTRATGGTGLGLYLCRELAERIGAKVWCESQLNKGSSFFLEVPPFKGEDKDQGKPK